MHAVHHDLRRAALAALAALILALAAIGLAPALTDVDLGGSGSSVTAISPPAPAPHSAAAPVWVTDPLASPLAQLRAPSR